METAQELQKYTSEARNFFLFHSADGVTDSAGAQVHLLARPRALPEGGEGVRFAYQTHYARCLSGGCGKKLLRFLWFAMMIHDGDFNCMTIDDIEKRHDFLNPF